MSVNDGSPVDAANTNAKLMSRTVDTSTLGVVALSNTATAASGPTLANAQRSINAAHSFVGGDPEGVFDQTPSWDSDVIGLPDENVKDRVDAIQVVVESNTTDLSTVVVGPGTVTDTAVPVFDGTTGFLVKETGVTIDASDNVIIPGNLTVSGTSTTINTATLDVEDVNITVNKNGDDASSEGAGLTVERTGTDGSFVYEDALTSKWKLGAAGAEVEVVTVSGAQVITAKDIDGGTASNTNRVTLPKNTTTNLDGLTRKAGTVFYDETRNNFFGDNGTTIISLGGGGGGGSKNYIDTADSDLELGVGAWEIFNDTGSVYVDGTSGTPSGGLAISVETSTSFILGGNQSLKIANDGTNLQGEGVSIASATIDRADRGRILNASMEIDFSAVPAGYDDYYQINAYDVTNAEIIAVPGELRTEIPKSKGKIQFQVPTKSTTEQVRLSIFIAGTDATTAHDVFIDDIKLGPDNAAPGYFGTKPAPYTPNFTGFGTVSTESFRFHREGSFLVVSGKFTPGTTTATEAQISLPNNLAITSTISGAQHVGTYTRANGAISNRGGWVLVTAGDTFVNFSDWFTFKDSSGGSTLNPLAAANGDDVALSGDAFSLEFKVEIEGWQASALVSSAETLFSSAKLKLSGDPASATVGNPIIFPTADWDTASAYNVSTGLYTAPKTGYYHMHGFIVSTSAAVGLFGYVNGISLGGIGNTDSNGEATVSGTVFANAGETISFRVGSTLDVQSGSYCFIDELPDFSIFSVSGTNEFLEATSSVKTPSTTGDYLLMTGNSIELTPGSWLLTGLVDANNSGSSPNYTQVTGAFHTGNGADSASEPTALTVEAGFYKTRIDGISSGSQIQLNTVVRKTVTSNETIYYVPRINATTVGNSRVTTYIYAERLV